MQGRRDGRDGGLSLMDYALIAATLCAAALAALNLLGQLPR
jgi:hypothetical protein